MNIIKRVECVFRGHVPMSLYKQKKKTVTER